MARSTSTFATSFHLTLSAPYLLSGMIAIEHYDKGGAYVSKKEHWSQMRFHTSRPVLTRCLAAINSDEFLTVCPWHRKPRWFCCPRKCNRHVRQKSTSNWSAPWQESVGPRFMVVIVGWTKSFAVMRKTPFRQSTSGETSQFYLTSALKMFVDGRSGFECTASHETATIPRPSQEQPTTDASQRSGPRHEAAVTRRKVEGEIREGGIE